MLKTIQLNVNGQARQVSTDPSRPLLDVLREDLRLTGAKFGCGEGQCRACTVLVNGKSTQSCLTDVGSVAGAKIETIESLAQGDKLHPVQKAFLEEDAMQCGYCVPGMIMSAVALLRQNPHPNRDEIIAGMNGNLCRCCGYVNLIHAIERAAQS